MTAYLILGYLKKLTSPELIALASVLTKQNEVLSDKVDEVRMGLTTEISSISFKLNSTTKCITELKDRVADLDRSNEHVFFDEHLCISCWTINVTNAFLHN